MRFHSADEIEIGRGKPRPTIRFNHRGPSMMIRCAVDKRSAMIPDTTSGRGLHLTQAD